MEQLDNARCSGRHRCPRSPAVVGRSAAPSTARTHNRDFRRSIMQNHRRRQRWAGITGDPNAGIGGGFVAKFLDELAKNCRALESALQNRSRPKRIYFSGCASTLPTLPTRRRSRRSWQRNSRQKRFTMTTATQSSASTTWAKGVRQAESQRRCCHPARSSSLQAHFNRIPGYRQLHRPAPVQHGGC